MRVYIHARLPGVDLFEAILLKKPYASRRIDVFLLL